MKQFMVWEPEVHVWLLKFQCNASEFTCNSGACIPLYYHCDDVEDCDDKSDEINCDIVSIDEKRYRQEFPPPPGVDFVECDQMNKYTTQYLDKVAKTVSVQENDKIFTLNLSLNVHNVFIKQILMPTNTHNKPCFVIGDNRSSLVWLP